MIKVRILSKCEHCEGKAYLPAGEVKDSQGRKFVRYMPCPCCEGSGSTDKYVDLPEFLQILEQDKCPHKHVSHIGSYHNSPDGVWDDIKDLCHDCGKDL